MPIDPKNAKKMAKELNTQNLNHLINQSDEIMRMVMEAGNMEMAEMAAKISAEAAAALIVRKNDVRELAKRVRNRVGEDEEEEKQEAAAPEAKAESPDPQKPE